MDNTSFSNLINNKSIVILAADKETYTLILNRKDYQHKVNNMINEGIAEGKYIETVEKYLKNYRYWSTHRIAIDLFNKSVVN